MDFECSDHFGGQFPVIVVFKLPNQHVSQLALRSVLLPRLDTLGQDSHIVSR